MDEERRRFLKYLIYSTGVFWLGKYFGILGCGSKEKNEIITSLLHFPQSVASGDVTQNSAVIWTRLADIETPVYFEVSEDENFSKIVSKDIAHAKKDYDYTIKIKLTGLSPGKRYFYRFIYDKYFSPVGKFKTIPQNPERLRFAFVSCQDYSNGFYSAWYHLSKEDLDFVVHLGDYIYETVSSPTFQYSQLRKIELNEKQIALYLEDYRKLYKIYRSDRYLQMAHENFPFYIIWDDHEFSNDSFQEYAPDNGKDIFGERQIRRRIEASRAWFEFMPADIYYDDKNQDPLKQIKIWRKFNFGNLARLILTDERLYRSRHPCGSGGLGGRYLSKGCEDMDKTTMLGEEQLNWFLEELKKAEEERVIWKIHGNEVGMSQMKLGGSFLNLDQWDGFYGERKKIFDFIVQKDIKNYFVITGDLHTFVVSELFQDFENLQKRVGVEFLVTSITSSNLGSLLRVQEKTLEEIEGKIVEENKHIKFFNSHYHGYAIVELTPEEAIVELWRVSSIEEPEVEKTEKILVKKYRVRKNNNIIEDITPK